MINKNDILDVEIIDMTTELLGVAKCNGFAIFVHGGVLGDKLKIKIVKVLKKFAYAIVIETIEASRYRVNSICEHDSKCGGCSGLNISYDKLLEIKKEQAINTLKKANLSFNLYNNSSIIPMENPVNYRNKVQYPVREVNGKIEYGMFKKRSHELIKIDSCILQDKNANNVSSYIFSLLKKYKFIGYNESTMTGEIKNILVRSTKYKEEQLVVLVISDRKLIKDERIYKLIKDIERDKKYNIKSVYLNINENKDNVILTDENICIYGNKYIKEKLGKYVFNISADSFFQVNTYQAEKLYDILKEKLGKHENENLLELFSGVSSIGIYLSENFNNITGIEIVKSASEMAKLNIKDNNIENYTVINGDAYIRARELAINEEKIDNIVVDPPRKGLDEDTIKLIKEIKPKRIGYVSCNVATLARDLKSLEEEYKILSVDFVDMFPFTEHSEAIVCLNLKG